MTFALTAPDRVIDPLKKVFKKDAPWNAQKMSGLVFQRTDINPKTNQELHIFEAPKNRVIAVSQHQGPRGDTVYTLHVNGRPNQTSEEQHLIENLVFAAK